MLILAGVSLNAIIGDNGIITKALNASFLSEMTAVQEAYELWQTSHYDDNEMPTNGIVQSKDINENGRLYGEIAYYRRWSETGIMPSTSIKLDTESFNSEYNGDILYLPRGVEDLYYLDNKKLGLEEDKKYIIDLTTGIIYAISGYTVENVDVHSLPMYKAVANGVTTAPKFAQAEVSGGGDNVKYAGEKYLKDKNGNYIDENGNIVDEENRVENPYGFEIISDPSNKNIYKLYNNGDLYAKGEKGFLLNSSKEEKESINPYIWKDIKLPNNIPGSSSNDVKIYPGYGTIFVVDSNKDLWAWGLNDNNVLGLSKEEQVEYNGRDIIKLNLFGKKVYKLFPLEFSTFVVTLDNGTYELYVCGWNSYGQLGIGNTETSQDCFTKVAFENPEKIVKITSHPRNGYHILALTEDGKCYFSGLKSELNFIFNGTDLSRDTYITKFTEIFNNKYGKAFDSKIIDVSSGVHYSGDYDFILTENKKLYIVSATKLEEQFFGTETGNVEKCYINCYFGFVKRKDVSGNVEYWVYYDSSENFYSSAFFGKLSARTWTKINDFLEAGDIDVTQIKDMFSTGMLSGSSVFILMNDGKLYGLGQNKDFGINDGITPMTESYQLIDISAKSNVKTVDQVIYNYYSAYKNPTFLLKVGDKYYITNDASLMYRNEIVKQNWIKIASNVEKFHASAYLNCLAYIDKQKDIWVLGEDARYLRNK